MICPLCLKKGNTVKVNVDSCNFLRCGGCLQICDQPILEKEDIEILKYSASYEGIYKFPFGYAVDRAAKSQAKLGMMLYRIYEKWSNNSSINPEMVINTTIKFILEFSKENAEKELSRISRELMESQKADIPRLFGEVNALMDKIMEMTTNMNKTNSFIK